MATPDAGSVPDPGGSIDYSAGSDPAGASGNDGPTEADMQALMDAGEAATDTSAPAPAAPAPAAPAPAAKAEPKKDEPPAPAAGDPAPEEAAKAAAETKRQRDELQAEAVKLRRGFTDLAQQKEKAVARMAEANALMARAREFEDKAKAYDGLPEKIKSDPLAFLESIGVSSDLILDKIVETEKSPVEREVARLKAEIAEKEAAAKKAAEDSALTAKKAADQKIIDDWAAANTRFASSSPENVAAYDLINSLGRGQDVHETCVAYHAKYNHILDPKTAAEHVEKHLRAGIAKSKFVQGLIDEAVAKAKAESPPAPAPAPAKAPAKAPEAATTLPAQKRTGPSTLAAVASGDPVPSSTDEIPEQGDDRFEAVVRGMQRAGELPDEWRFSGPQ